MDQMQIKCEKVFWRVFFTLFVASFGKCEDGDIRLAGSVKSYEGRVEVENNGIWGTICSDSWGHDDAGVVCRQLGFSRGAMLASSVGLTTFMSGSGPVFLTGLMCNGNENQLSACRGYQLQVTSPCNHSKDAVVVCQLPSYEGCYMEETSGFVERNILRDGDMTISFCISICRVYDFTYARLGSGSVCQCGNNMTRFGSERAGSDCNTVCTGDLDEICGGEMNSNTYSYFSTYLGSSSGSYEDSSGFIASPDFPGVYPAGENGIWTVILGGISSVNFTFVYIHLHIDDSVEIIPIPNGERIVIDSKTSQPVYQVTSSVFEIRFTASVNTPEAYYGFLLHYQASTTEILASTTTRPIDDNCQSIGSLFETGDNNSPSEGTMLFYREPLKCSGSLTTLRVNCQIKDDFNVTLWREDNSGKIFPVKSIPIDINSDEQGDDGYCLFNFEADGQDIFRTRAGDRLSLDFSLFPFVHKAVVSGSDDIFVMMDSEETNGTSLPDLERSLDEATGIVISLQIKFRERDVCQQEFRHTTLISEYTTIFEGDVVNIVCDRYYHSSVSTAVCLQGGKFENHEDIACNRTCPSNFGAVENLNSRTVRHNVPDELILNTGQPLPCRGSILSVTYFARPNASFSFSTWRPEENGSYVLFENCIVEGDPNKNNDSAEIISRDLTKELRFYEGYILGISYFGDSPVGFTANSTRDVDTSTYLVWNITNNEITEERELLTKDAEEQLRSVSVQLTLQAVNRCSLDLTGYLDITSENEDVQEYIPDGFVQAGDVIELTCEDGQVASGEMFTCQETGSFDRTPECISSVSNASQLWILLIMGFTALGVGLFGVTCLICYWLCTIPEPSRKVDQVEEYILNRRTVEDFPDSLPSNGFYINDDFLFKAGDSEDGEFFDGVDRNTFDVTTEGNEYEGYSSGRVEENSVPPPYDPDTDSFNTTLPAPRAVTFADESDNDIQADDGRSSPVHGVNEGEQTVPRSAEEAPPSMEIPPPPFEEPPAPPVNVGDNVPSEPLPPPPSEEA